MATLVCFALKEEAAPHCDLAEQFTFYSVNGRDVCATVELYKIWKERLTGIK